MISHSHLCPKSSHGHQRHLHTSFFIFLIVNGIVNIQFGQKNLPIVNVHLERERLRLITPHWPSYPNAVGIILGDFNICEPEEGRFNVWNQTFTDGDAGKTAMFHSFFHMFSRMPNLITLRGIIRTLSRIDRIFSNLPMAEARDFHCYFHVFENLVNRSIPSDHAAVRLVRQKPSNRGQQCKRSTNWMSKHTVFLLYFEAASR